ncbi:MAG: hypothetical protein ACODAC_06820, partial [Pseudomonadota bacterium]
ALHTARRVTGGVTCGPARAVLDEYPALSALMRETGFRWSAPAAGPAASARAALGDGGDCPMLLTSGDHGLLSAATVDAFCAAAARAASASALDVVVGLVPWPRVRDAFPDSRRTVLSFADGGYCGANLFALTTADAGRALEFWSSVEADRKHPAKIARRLGAGLLVRYAAGRLRLDEAFDALSRRTGCRIGWVEVADPRAAVDVDSRKDWELAQRVLADPRAEPGGTP